MFKLYVSSRLVFYNFIIFILLQNTYSSHTLGPLLFASILGKIHSSNVEYTQVSEMKCGWMNGQKKTT